MICLYAADESLFEHNGLGILDNDLKKCHVEEELNNLYTLTAQYPLGAKFGKSIRNGMIIKAPTPNGDQLFRIYQSKPSMGMLEIHAFHIFYDLAFNFVEDTNIVSKSGQAWLQQLSQNTQYSHPFTFFSDISTVAGSRVVRKNCVEILLNTSLDNSFVNRFGGEILRDNFNVYFNRAIGENRGFKIRHKKNLKGYTANIDDKSVITRIMPIGFDGLLLPEKYVDSPRISDYPFPRISKVEVDVKAAVGENTDAKDAIPLNEAYTKMRALIKEQFGVVDVPTCSYEVDFVELSKTKEYADFQNLETVRIGDTVTVSHDEDGFYVEAKVIRYEYDSLAGRLLRIEAGQFESRSSNNSINQQRSIEQQLEDVKIETSNMVQVAANGKNTIYRGVDRPTNANVGDLWYEPLENSVVLKQWSGVDWELIPISDQNLGNVNVNNLSGNYIDVRRFRISSGDRDILYVNEAGEVILNAKRIQIDFTDVATKTDLQEIELTPGPQGAVGVGIQSTVSTYGLSANETTQPASWSASVPTLVKGQYLWTKNVWTYTDGRTETGYTKTYIPKDGNNGTNGIAGKDGVGITSTVITYARSTSGTSAPTSGWTSSVPTVPPGEFLWTKTVWNYSDNTNETGYSVAKIGDTGPRGADGQTPYVHWAYSDKADGTGLTTSDNGQRYIGHYSDYTQADSTDKTKYTWSDRWAKIEVGGRNYFKQSTIASSAGANAVQAFSYRGIGTPNGFKVTGNSTEDGIIRLFDVINSDGLWTVSFDMRGSQSVPVSLYVSICDQGATKVTTNNTNTYQRYSVTVNVTSYSTNPNTYNFVNFGNIAWANFWIDNIMIEKASAPSDFQLAPEDIQVNIDTKADQALTQQQLNMLIEKAQTMQTELEARASMETLSDLERAYNAYVEANDKAVKKSEADLIEAGRRVDAMVEILGGLSKTKTFIDTYIKEAEEGIIIGTNDNVSQIRVTYDRIAMYSAGKEVMYISQGVINIDNGVFTKSLQIGRFRTEQHQTNLDINVCRYVG
ncbi:phage tail spike protein [Streptococcus parasuis]|uniref:phage tail spike protein n=1 Tax=Streptococcus parasuis TaxID=1501662 RepID=UPI0028AB9AFA|nr:phage tail spike protein [Streptococcus parasuis]